MVSSHSQPLYTPLVEHDCKLAGKLAGQLTQPATAHTSCGMVAVPMPLLALQEFYCFGETQSFSSCYTMSCSHNDYERSFHGSGF